MSSDYPLMNIVHGNEPLSSVDLSVVVPVYACAGSLSELHRRLTAVLSQLVDRYEIVFVDDRARDGSWAMLQKLAAEDPNVVACRLSRNFGQQLAITAGLAECCGEYAIVMDCDLQDPPEFIPDLLAEARRGFDIVLANRRSDYHSGLRGHANRFYFWLLGAVSGREFSGDPGSFSIISRRIIDAFLSFRERDRHYLMVLNWLGFNLEHGRFRSRATHNWAIKLYIENASRSRVFWPVFLHDQTPPFRDLYGDCSRRVCSFVGIILCRPLDREWLNPWLDEPDCRGASRGRDHHDVRRRDGAIYW